MIKMHKINTIGSKNPRKILFLSLNVVFLCTF